MNKIEAPGRFTADGKDGADWSYGVAVERPLDAPPQDTQALEAAGTGESGTADARDAAGAVPDEAAGAQDGRPSEGDGRSTEEAPAGAARNEEGDGSRSQETAPRNGEERDESPPAPPGKLVFVIAGLVLLGLLGWGAYGHWHRSREASATTENTINAVPEVRATEAKRDDKPIELTLPGQTEAFETANIFARATGYVTKRHVDIGSRVKKGDLLVHIAAPDLDQQLAQAVAQLGQVKASEAQAAAQVAQAEANLNLAKVTLARTATLTQQGYDTLQNRDNQVANQQAQQANLDTARAGVKVAQANTKAQEAAIDRLQALTGFEDVIAPFDGIITTRNIDNGDLINADTASATPMFSIARDDVIRVTVQVPQNSSAGVREGVPASVEVPSAPGMTFAGSVTRSSVALLSSARTLDTEVDVQNPDGSIRPGLFVYVTMHIPREHPQVVVPAEALMFNQNGLRVAVVDNGQAKLRTVKIARDLGTTVALSDGLDGGEQVIVSPPTLLRDGQKVQVKKPEEDKKPEGGGQPGQDDGAAQGSSKPDADKQG